MKSLDESGNDGGWSSNFGGDKFGKLHFFAPVVSILSAIALR